MSDPFGPGSYFNPAQIASGTSGGPLTDIQMREFTYAGMYGPRPYIEQVPEDERTLVLEKSFYACLCLAFIVGLVLSFGYAASVIIVGALLPLALWLLVVVFTFTRRAERRLMSAIKQAQRKHEERRLAEGHLKWPKMVKLKPLSPPCLLSPDIASKPPSAERRAIVDGVFKRLTDGGKTGHGQMGLPYIKDGPTGDGIGWDCSSLMRFLWEGVNGVDLEGNAEAQFQKQAAAGRLLPDPKGRDLQRGDLMFFIDPTGRVSHVAMYEGPETRDRAKMVEANHPGGNVVEAHYAPIERGKIWAPRNPRPDEVLYYIGASRPGPL